MELVIASGRASCRQCGQKIAKGEQAIKGCYDVSQGGNPWLMSDVQIHLHDCKKEKIDVCIIYGSEGPRHDPYSFTEYQFILKGVDIILHEGLSCWLQIGDERIHPEFGPRYDQSCFEMKEKFEKMIGHSLDELEEYWHSLPEDPMGSPGLYR